MEQTADVGEDGIIKSSSAAAAASRWSTAWSSGQPHTSHGHQLIAECPVGDYLSQAISLK